MQSLVFAGDLAGTISIRLVLTRLEEGKSLTRDIGHGQSHRRRAGRGSGRSPYHGCLIVANAENAIFLLVCRSALGDGHGSWEATLQLRIPSRLKKTGCSGCSGCSESTQDNRGHAFSFQRKGLHSSCTFGSSRQLSLSASGLRASLCSSALFGSTFSSTKCSTTICSE